jgi:hypothetical protein
VPCKHASHQRRSRKASRQSSPGCCKNVSVRAIAPVRPYSFAQAASIPKALSEIMVAIISTIIGVQIPRFDLPRRDDALINLAKVRHPTDAAGFRCGVGATSPQEAGDANAVPGSKRRSGLESDAENADEAGRRRGQGRPRRLVKAAWSICGPWASFGSFLSVWPRRSYRLPESKSRPVFCRL